MKFVQATIYIFWLSYKEFSFKRYEEILSQAMASGCRIYSAAYIMPSGKTSFGFSQKHKNHLRLIEFMMRDDVTNKIANAEYMKEAYGLLSSYPMMGPFLAYQSFTRYKLQQHFGF